MTIQKTLIILGVIAALVLALFYFTGNWGMVLSTYEYVKTYVAANWMTVTGAIGGVTTAAGVATKYIGDAKAEVTKITSQVSSFKSEATGQISSISSELSDTQKQVTTKEQEISALQKELTDLKANAPDVAAYNTQISNLQGQVTGITDQHNTFVKSLMQAANNTLVTDPLTGITYNCIKPPPEIHVK